MFSKRFEYCYVLYSYILDRFQENDNEIRYLTGQEILMQVNVPKQLGLKLLSKLVKNEILGSSRGRGKGFFLLSKKITFWDFYLAIEGNKSKNLPYQRKIKVFEFNLQKELNKRKV